MLTCKCDFCGKEAEVTSSIGFNIPLDWWKINNEGDKSSLHSCPECIEALKQLMDERGFHKMMEAIKPDVKEQKH